MRILVITLLFSLTATAGEVTDFKPRPAVVEAGTETYVGILLSEEDFRKLLQDKVSTNAKIAECDVDKRVCNKIQEAYRTSIKELQESAQKENTWFQRNKGSLGLLSGIVIGVGTSIAIVKAVQPSQ